MHCDASRAVNGVAIIAGANAYLKDVTMEHNTERGLVAEMGDRDRGLEIGRPLQNYLVTPLLVETDQAE